MLTQPIIRRPAVDTNASRAGSVDDAGSTGRVLLLQPLGLAPRAGTPGRLQQEETQRADHDGEDRGKGLDHAAGLFGSW